MFHALRNIRYSVFVPANLSASVVELYIVQNCFFTNTFFFSLAEGDENKESVFEDPLCEE